MEWVDSHAHLKPTKDSFERFIGVMKELSISHAFIVGGGTLDPAELSKQMALGGGTDVSVDNRALLSLCLMSEKQIFPLYFANPHASTKEYEKEGHAFAGLKLGPAVHGVPLNDERVTQFVEVAALLNHTVYLHCLPRHGFDIAAFVILASRFPNVNFILGHAGIGNCDVFAVRMIQGLANIYFETSGGFSSVVSFAFEQLGADRVLWGTEYPLQHPRIEMEKARVLNLTEEHFEKYTRTNALTLLGKKYA